MKKNEQFYLTYFKGKVPLKISFWGIYVFAWNIVLGFLLGIIFVRMGFEINTFKIFAAPITGLLAVGVWNSAGNYKGKKIIDPYRVIQSKKFIENKKIYSLANKIK